MASIKYPRTIKSGPLRGRTFASQADYDTARRAGSDGPASSDGPPSRKPDKRAVRYSKKMVEAVVKMVEGMLSIPFPFLRNDDQPGRLPLSEQERGWLVQDWYDFGVRNVWFQRLLGQVFGVDLYAKLAVDHLVVIGGRVVARSENPRVQALALPVNVAYMIRTAMDAEADVSLGDILGMDQETVPVEEPYPPESNGAHGGPESPDDAGMSVVKRWSYDDVK